MLNNKPLIAKKTEKLEQLKTRRRDLLNKLCRYLKTIRDEEVRETLILYYIDGVRYCDLPEYLGLEGDGSWLMQKAKKYVQKKGRDDRLP